ncbi:MAG: DUF4031 domain-containing protein [Acidiferrobacterales bacterium]
MTVYVDAPIHPFGRMIMCHMLADSIDELHRMADRIGVDRRHFQSPPKSSAPHYDICKSKRALALQHGAREIDRHALVALMRRWRVAGARQSSSGPERESDNGRLCEEHAS